MNKGSLEFCFAKEKALERALASTCNEEDGDEEDSDDDEYQIDEEEEEQPLPKTELSNKRTKLPDSASNFSMTQQYLSISKRAKSSV
jgi:hypothetical protein